MIARRGESPNYLRMTNKTTSYTYLRRCQATTTSSLALFILLYLTIDWIHSMIGQDNLALLVTHR